MTSFWPHWYHFGRTLLCSIPTAPRSLPCGTAVWQSLAALRLHPAKCGSLKPPSSRCDIVLAALVSLWPHIALHHSDGAAISAVWQSLAALRLHPAKCGSLQAALIQV